MAPCVFANVMLHRGACICLSWSLFFGFENRRPLCARYSTVRHGDKDNRAERPMPSSPLGMTSTRVTLASGMTVPTRNSIRSSPLTLSETPWGCSQRITSSRSKYRFASFAWAGEGRIYRVFERRSNRRAHLSCRALMPDPEERAQEREINKRYIWVYTID